MGTHGRNAVTKDGVTASFEQTHDGHGATGELLVPLLKSCGKEILSPTMEDETDELDHEEYCHIDYDRKIVYAYAPDPKMLRDTGPGYLAKDCYLVAGGPPFGGDAITFEDAAQAVQKMVRDGWRFVFDCRTAPREYGAPESIDASIEDFLSDDPYVRFVMRIQAAGHGTMALPTQFVFTRTPRYAGAVHSQFQGIYGILAWDQVRSDTVEIAKPLGVLAELPGLVATKNEQRLAEIVQLALEKGLIQ